mmetsp:Transcript_30534/g.66039  ORF Transcript_30534/g.66039 Transcript_30534/m.66039 type:complete len:115 (-) Transcript_30534:1568-1912(-)
MQQQTASSATPMTWSAISELCQIYTRHQAQRSLVNSSSGAQLSMVGSLDNIVDLPQRKPDRAATIYTSLRDRMSPLPSSPLLLSAISKWLRSPFRRCALVDLCSEICWASLTPN